MKLLSPLAFLFVAAALPAFAAPADAKAYAAVDAKLFETLNGIRRDLIALSDSGEFPQLKGIEESEIKRLDYVGNHKVLIHRKDAFPVDGGGFRCGEDGYIIKLDLLSYDAKSDPRCGVGAAVVRPIPHYQIKVGGIPYGVEHKVAAGDTESGKAFVKAVTERIEARLAGMNEELGAAPVTWDALINPPKPSDEAALEKQAYIILEGVVTGHSAERYKETNQPQRIKLKVTKVLGGRKGHEDWARVDELIELDSWQIKPPIDLPVGTAIKGYLNIGHTVHAENDHRPFYCAVGPNAVQIITKSSP